MKTSEKIDEFACALNQAQGIMTGAKKGNTNPFLKNKYADLASVIHAISKPFADNGLSFIQAAEFNEGRVMVTTRILHESGQWIESVTELPPTKNDAQGYGSALTYAKRYGLQSLCGVPSEDDDGSGAVAHKKDGQPKQTQQQAIGGWCNRLMGCKSLFDLQATWRSVPKDLQIACAKSKEAAKAKLSTKVKPTTIIDDSINGFEDGDVPL